MKKQINSILISILTVLVYSVPTPALAKGKADKETPAVEGQCDILQEDGFTKGLYGLCVAFCEAHDASEEFLTEDGFVNLTTPNIKILEHYNRKRDELAGDPEMPCARTIEPVDCPAFVQDVINNIHAMIPEQSADKLMFIYDDDMQQSYINGGNIDHRYGDYAAYITSLSSFSFVAVALEYKEFDSGKNGNGIDSLIARYEVMVNGVVTDSNYAEVSLSPDTTQQDIDNIESCKQLIDDNTFPKYE